MQTIKIKLAGLLALWTIPAMLSCRRENLSGNPSVADSTALFSAMIDGVSWQTDSISAFLVCPAADQPRIMTISAFADDRVITMSLRDTARGGDDSTLSLTPYDVGSWGDAAAFGYAYHQILLGRDLIWQVQGNSSGGGAVVTACDGATKRISGTFHFTARVLKVDSLGVHADTVSVDSGVMKNVSYSFFQHQ